MSDTVTEPDVDPVVQVEFGLWWPSSDPDRLRDLASAWEAVAVALDDASEAVADHRSAVTGANEGVAIDAFAGFLDGWTGSHLPEASAHCRDLADACSDFAAAVGEARDTIRQLAIEIAASIAIGVGLAILTAGISADAAAAVTAAAVTRAGIVATSLAARVIAIVSRVVTFAGVGAFEAGATNLVIQTGRNAATNQNYDPFTGYNRDELTISTAGGAVFGAAFGGFRSIPLIRGIEPPVPPPPRLPPLPSRSLAGPDLSTRGIRPRPGTRIRPDGIPPGWRTSGTRSTGGTRYYDLTDPGNSGRVMQGNPHSPHPGSRSPYVRWQRGGAALDVNGRVLPSAKHPDAHIPLADFRFHAELFR